MSGAGASEASIGTECAGASAAGESAASEASPGLAVLSERSPSSISPTFAAAWCALPATPSWQRLCVRPIVVLECEWMAEQEVASVQGFVLQWLPAPRKRSWTPAPPHATKLRVTPPQLDCLAFQHMRCSSSPTPPHRRN